MQNRLKLYFISEKYISYLRKYDEKVPFNKSQTRPFIGVVYSYNDNNYFAPLSSPKPKHLKMSNKAIDVWKINHGKLGIININNMLPCPIEVLTEVIPTIKDEKYKMLLENQISSINADRESLFKKINRFQKKYRLDLLNTNVKERCCDFQLLEEKCKEYVERVRHNENEIKVVQ